MSSIHGYLSTNALKTPNKPFLTDSEGSWSYQQTENLSNSFSNILLTINFQEGGRLGIFHPNSKFFALSHFAALKAGGISVPMDPGLRSKNLAYILNLCAINHIVTTKELWETHRSLLENQSVFLTNPPSTSDSLPKNVHSLPKKIMGTPTAPIADKSTNESAAAILFTSGTTGNPRGVVLTHGNLEAAAKSIIKFTGLGPDEKEMIVLPMTHLFGLGHLHVNTINGAQIFIERNLLEPIETLQRLKNLGITSFPGVPTAYSYLMDRFAPLLKECSESLSRIVLNSTAMPPERTKKLTELLPKTRIFMYYGLTEASRATFICYNDVPESLWKSVGQNSPGVNISIVDENLIPIARDLEGEILVQGPNVMKEYLNDPKSTSQALTPSGLRTGDLGRMDQNGFIFLTGRIKEMINVGGSKLNPREVEEILKFHPGILDCAVTGINDPNGIAGERVKAFIVNKPGFNITRQEILELCSKHLETYKIPQIVEFCETLPRTDSGKLKRTQLGSRAQQE